MSIDINLIKTIIVVMMENRSFDNMLGYLNLAAYKRDTGTIDGLQDNPAWLDKVANTFGKNRYRPFLLTDPYDPIPADPPHERDFIASQMGKPVSGTFPMDGFVANYANAPEAPTISTEIPPPVMGYFTPEQVPMTDFLAQNFAICDHWFSALPAGTQPNRLMAMSGFSNIDVNQCPLPDQELVYDWLTKRGIRWRVYHEDMPFFSMMLRWVPDIIHEEHFRPFSQFLKDVENEPPDQFPQVIFIEPSYTDAPHLGPTSDDHAPSAVKGGQGFLQEVYRCVMSYPDLWDGSVTIVTYDEHGGFFDHVSPPAIRTDPPTDIGYRGFETLGVRVPAFIISPFVKPKTVFNEILDHTSILKFIGKKFGEGGSYSELVDKRPVGNVYDILNKPNSRSAVTAPSLTQYLEVQIPSVGYTPGTAANTTNQKAFKKALDAIEDHPDRPNGKFDPLLALFSTKSKAA